MSATDILLPCRDGATLAGTIFLPRREPLGLLVLCHGLGEHVARYAAWAGQLNNLGWGLFGTDLRGHGRNPGPRGVARDTVQLMDDLEDSLAFARQRCPGVPLFLYGHSLGGQVVLTCLHQRRPHLAGAVVTAPWLTLVRPPTAPVRWIVRRLRHIAPRLPLPTLMRSADLYRPKERAASEYPSDPLNHNRIGAGLLDDALQQGHALLRAESPLPCPVLLAHGMQDRVTCYQASAHYAARHRERVTFASFPDGYHELHRDITAPSWLAQLTAWLASPGLPSTAPEATLPANGSEST